MPVADDPAELAREVDRLRAERDDLAGEVQRLGAPARGGRSRRLLVGTLVGLACVSFLAASLGFWANRNLLNTDTWVKRVGPLASDAAVQTALSAAVTNQVMTLINPEMYLREELPDRAQVLAAPLAGAVSDFVSKAVDRVVQADAFARVWTQANRRAHAAAVALLRGNTPPSISTDGDKVTFSLVPAIDNVLKDISAQSPEILGRQVNIPDLSVDEIPAKARDKLSQALGVPLDKDFGTFTVYDGGAVSSAQDAVKIFDAVFVGSTVLTVVCAAAALLLTRGRRRTGLQLLVGAVIVVVLIRRLVLLLVSEVVGLAKVPRNADAVKAVLDAFADPLLNTSAVVLWILVAAIAALVLTSRYPWVVRLRGAASDLVGGVTGSGTPSARPSVAWVGSHVRALQVAGGLVFVAVVWWASLSWLALLVLAAVVAAFELWVNRLGDGVAEAEASAAGSGLGPG